MFSIRVGRLQLKNEVFSDPQALVRRGLVFNVTVSMLKFLSGSYNFRSQENNLSI